MDNLNKLNVLEENRLFCKHGLTHLMDVARLMYIYNLEDNALIPKDIIYATALLHDLGRVKEYEEGISHDEGSVMLAKLILPECGYDKEEVDDICEAILHHRSNSWGELRDTLSMYLKAADKKSRPCFTCEAKNECNWPIDKRNMFFLL